MKQWLLTLLWMVCTLLAFLSLAVNLLPLFGWRFETYRCEHSKKQAYVCGCPLFKTRKGGESPHKRIDKGLTRIYMHSIKFEVIPLHLRRVCKVENKLYVFDLFCCCAKIGFWCLLLWRNRNLKILIKCIG